MGRCSAEAPEHCAVWAHCSVRVGRPLGKEEGGGNPDQMGASHAAGRALSSAGCDFSLWN